MNQNHFAVLPLRPFIVSSMSVFVFLFVSAASNAWGRSETGYGGSRPDEAARLAQKPIW